MTIELTCQHCGRINQLVDRVGFRDTCDGCGADLHSCRHCSHYDPSAYHECREPSADYVKDKEKANYCDHFSPQLGQTSKGSRPKTRDELRAAAEALFQTKKKTN